MEDVSRAHPARTINAAREFAERTERTSDGGVLVPEREPHLPLRVLIADQSSERLAVLATIVRGAGHQVVAGETDVSKVAHVTLTSHPDVALVALGESEEHALALITEIVAEAACPVIAVAPDRAASFAYEAARRGIYAYVVDTDISGLENALQIVLLRFQAYHGLEGAFGRRAMIEQAKGIIMERHGIDQAAAFDSLRRYARSHNKTMVDVATSVIEGTLELEPHNPAEDGL